MTVDTPTEFTLGEPRSRKQREQQLLEMLRDQPMEIYAAYLKTFGSGDAESPTLTPLAMVKSLVEHEFPSRNGATE